MTRIHRLFLLFQPRRKASRHPPTISHQFGNTLKVRARVKCLRKTIPTLRGFTRRFSDLQELLRPCMKLSAIQQEGIDHCYRDRLGPERITASAALQRAVVTCHCMDWDERSEKRVPETQKARNGMRSFTPAPCLCPEGVRLTASPTAACLAR